MISHPTFFPRFILLLLSKPFSLSLSEDGKYCFLRFRCFKPLQGRVTKHFTFTVIKKKYSFYFGVDYLIGIILCLFFF